MESKLKKCINYDELKKQDESWPEHCWPCTLFEPDDYPCRKCKVQKERYKELLEASVQNAYANKDSSIHLIKYTVSRYSGTIVDISGDYGLLIGATATLEDYYWVYIDSDLKVCYSSCVGGIDEIEEIPAKFSILSYMMKNQKQDLLDKVMKSINSHKDTDLLITPITIRQPGT